MAEIFREVNVYKMGQGSITGRNKLEVHIKCNLELLLKYGNFVSLKNGRYKGIKPGKLEQWSFLIIKIK